MALLRPLGVATYVEPSNVVVPRSVLGANATHVRTNWRGGVELTTRWETEKSSSPVNAIEQRSGRRLRPERSLRSSHLLYGADYEFGLQHVHRFVPRQANPTQVNLSTFGFGSYVQTPLGCDATKVTLVEASGGEHKVWCDTRWRRFYVGARVYLIPPTPTVFTISTIRTNVMLAVITAVDDEWLQIITPPSLPAQGWMVEPCLDVIPQLSQTVSNVTGRVAELELEAVEASGVSSLPPRTLPVGMPTHTGRDGVNRVVVDLSIHNWQGPLEWDVVREGQGADFANGSDTFSTGLRPKRRAEVQARFFSRETAWHLLSVFDAMQGRRGAFWAVFPNLVIDRLPLTPSATSITIPYQGDMLEWRFTTDAIAFKLEDGTWSIHELTTISDNLDGTWDVDISPALPAISLATCVRWAARAAFDSDEVTESWTSIEVVDVAFPIVELSNPSNLQMTAP